MIQEYTHLCIAESLKAEMHPVKDTSQPSLDYIWNQNTSFSVLHVTLFKTSMYEQFFNIIKYVFSYLIFIILLHLTKMPMLCIN